MMQFTFMNDANISAEQKEQAKQAWRNKLGKFQKEFDDKNGFITIDFSIPLDDNRYYSCTFQNHDIFEFNHRFNEWQLEGRP